jgi:hypothetical protein
VDFNGVVEGYPGETTYAVYLVKHHGAEQKHTQDMGSTNWDYDDVEQAVKHMAWFDPMAVDGIGLGKRIENPGDHDGGG